MKADEVLLAVMPAGLASPQEMIIRRADGSVWRRWRGANGKKLEFPARSFRNEVWRVLHAAKSNGAVLTVAGQEILRQRR